MSNVIDELMDDPDFRRLMKEINRKSRKYYWNDAIQSQDKANSLNLERRKFNPSVTIRSTKRIGINRRKALLSSNDNFNECNN